VQKVKSAKELSKGLKCVIYDTLLLAGALKQLRENYKCNKEYPFVYKQIIFEMALIKIRSM